MTIGNEPPLHAPILLFFTVSLPHQLLFPPTKQWQCKIMLWSHLRLWHCRITSVTLMSGRQNASRKGLSFRRAVGVLYCTIRLSYSFLVSSTSSQMQLSRPAGSTRLLLSKTLLVSVSHQPLIYNHFRQLAVCEVHWRKTNRHLCDCNRGCELFWWF